MMNFNPSCFTNSLLLSISALSVFFALASKTHAAPLSVPPDKTDANVNITYDGGTIAAGGTYTVNDMFARVTFAQGFTLTNAGTFNAINSSYIDTQRF